MKFVFQKTTIKKFGPQLNKDEDAPKLEIAKQALAFCSGTEAEYSMGKRSSHCWSTYQLLQGQVDSINEGGPFGTPTRALFEFCESMINHPKLNEIDRKRIKECV